MLYLIANPLSGGGKGAAALAEAEACLKQNKVEYKLLISQYATQAMEHGAFCAKEEQCTAIAVLGGDGTFNEVVTGLDGCKKPVGFIGAGTGNDFIRAVQLPKDVKTAVDVILAGKTRSIDVMQLASRKCLNVLGTGFDVELLLRANRYRKRLKGEMSYYVSLLVTLFRFKFRTFTFKVDGGPVRSERAFMMSLGNGKYCGGGLPVAPDAKPDDGLIDLVIIKKFNRIKLIGMLIKFLQGKVNKLKCTEHICCKQISFKVEPKLELNCDGELISEQPVNVSILPAELNMFTV